jgi:hypothetical protein
VVLCLLKHQRHTDVGGPYAIWGRYPPGCLGRVIADNPFVPRR